MMMRYNYVELDKLKIDLCEISLSFESEILLKADENILRFETKTGGNEPRFIKKNDPDVTIRIRPGRTDTPGGQIGEGALLYYTQEGGVNYAAGQAGERPSAIVTRYTPDFKSVETWLDFEDYGQDVLQFIKVLQHLPMRELLVRYDALLFHSSRVKLSGQAILFSAPSETGKTTQARLWEKYMGARIVSNDCSILRNINGKVISSGYPMDGGEVAADASQIAVAAIVILSQGEGNRLECLPASRALKLLMEQTAADGWNGREIAALQLLWISILEKVPVYHLTCTPDERAVVCLCEGLKERGISFERNT